MITLSDRASAASMIIESDEDSDEFESQPPSWEWILIIGGVLMAIGSFLPWTYATIYFVTLTRDGMQLGLDRGFSIDGLITLMFGLFAMLIGISRTRQTTLPNLIALIAIADGLIGLAVGVYDLIRAFAYITSVKSGLEFVTSGVGCGIWIVIGGSALVTASGIFSRLGNSRNS